MPKSITFNWKGLLLWSNHFYGLCATLLSIESTVVFLNQAPSIFTIAFIYLTTLVFYTHAYLNESSEGIYNERSSWYAKNKKYLLIRQVVFSLIIIYLALFKLGSIELFLTASISTKCVLLFSIIISAFYYFPFLNSNFFTGIRSWGVTKSASIAWVWAVMCCLVPLLFTDKLAIQQLIPTTHFLLYFSQLFIFILLLAILFDIKDLIRDKEEMVNTIVLKYGVDETIQKFATPLIIIYFIISFIIYYLYHQTILYLLAQLLLLLMVYFAISTIKKVKSIHYNILLIDGLMIVKALIGIVYATYH